MNRNIFLVAAGAIQLAYDEMINDPDGLPPNGRAMRELLTKTHTGDNYDWLYMEYLMGRFREIAGIDLDKLHLSGVAIREILDTAPTLFRDEDMLYVEFDADAGRQRARVPSHLASEVEAMAWVWGWL